MTYQPFDSPAVINDVHPGDILAAAAHLPAKPQPDKTTQYGKDAVFIQAHHHPHPHGDLAGPRRVWFVQRAFPGLRDFDRKGVFGFRRGFDFAGFIPRIAERVLVNGRGAGVEPNRRRIGALTNRCLLYTSSIIIGHKLEAIKAKI